MYFCEIPVICVDIRAFFLGEIPVLCVPTRFFFSPMFHVATHVFFPVFYLPTHVFFFLYFISLLILFFYIGNQVISVIFTWLLILSTGTHIPMSSTVSCRYNVLKVVGAVLLNCGILSITCLVAVCTCSNFIKKRFGKCTK